MESNILRDILNKGILAPSADNLQPWKFRIQGSEIDVFLDEEKLANFCDSGYFMPYLSAGAVIENMRVASIQAGFNLRSLYLPQRGVPSHVARLSFEKAVKTKHPHYKALNLRVTNRKFYEARRPVDPSVYLRLSKMAELEGFKLKWIEKGQKQYAGLSRILGEADQIRFESQRLVREFLDILRFGKTQAEKTRDGLEINTLEAGPLASPLFKLIRSWGRLRFLNCLGLSRSMKTYTEKQLKSSQAVGLITALSQKPESYVKGGEITERVWHEIASLGLSLQPMEGLPIFIINLQLSGGTDFTPAQKAKLESLKASFFSLFGINDNHGLIFLFRLGYASAPRARSLRRPVETFIQ